MTILVNPEDKVVIVGWLAGWLAVVGFVQEKDEAGRMDDEAAADINYI